MALIKQEIIKGIEAEYWKIIKLHSNVDKNFIDDFIQPPESTLVELALYKNEDIRKEDNSNFFYTKSMSLDGIYTNRDECYEALKNTEFFKDAIDG